VKMRPDFGVHIPQAPRAAVWKTKSPDR